MFCSLGTWQLYRLQWKMELISEITFGLNSTPIKYSNNIEKNYQRVTSDGEYNFENQIYLYSLNEKGKPGYDIITPFKTSNNENILVNRGWIDKKLKGLAVVNSNKKAKITGLLRKIYKANMFKPENDIKNNIWYSLKLEDLESFTGYKLNNFVLYLQDNQNNLVKNKIVSPDLPNNHLKYAITWYSVALSILLYFLYFRKKQ